VANTPFAERTGEFSPDGRFVAYDTDESGRSEIKVQAFPEATDRWPVSTGGGSGPRWSADGREIYFVAPDGKMMVVPVETRGSRFEAGTPVVLFSTQIRNQPFKFLYAVSRAGRFLFANSTAEEAIASPITLVLNSKP